MARRSKQKPKAIYQLTKAEFKQLFLALMIGNTIMSSVAELHGKNWQEIESQSNFFINLAEELGFSDLIEQFKGIKLPVNSLCLEEEKIIEDYNEEEFWEGLMVRLGQRDFFKDLTPGVKEEQKKKFWISEKIEKYYEKYRKEFEKYGVNRLVISPSKHN